MKGTTTPNIAIEYWTKGDELNTDSRKYFYIQELRNGFKVTENWKKYNRNFH